MSSSAKTASRKTRWHSALTTLALCITLTACATYRGVSEFNVYRTSFQAAAGVGNDILDRLAVAERGLYKIAYPFDPLRSVFDPEDASYFVDVVDPPATASYRRTLLAVTTFNEALYELASGAEAAALAAKITTLSAIGAAAAADVASLADAAGTTGPVASVTAAKSVNTVLKGLEPITAQVIAFQKRQEFRERLLTQGATIRAAIVEVRKSTRDVFNKLQDAVITQVNADPNRTGLTDAERDEVHRTWTLIAHWTVLLDASLSSLDVAANAVNSDAGMGTFDGVLYGGAQLGEAVSAARRNLAGGG